MFLNLSSFQFIILNFCYAKLENIGYTCTICIYTNTCINLLNSWIYLCKRWKLANWVNIFGCKLNIEIKKYVKVWLTWCLHKRTTLAIWKDTFRCCKTFYKKKKYFETIQHAIFDETEWFTISFRFITTDQNINIKFKLINSNEMCTIQSYIYFI